MWKVPLIARVKQRRILEELASYSGPRASVAVGQDLTGVGLGWPF
jgi:hypothetical protein